MLPWATGPLTLLKSIAKVPDPPLIVIVELELFFCDSQALTVLNMTVKTGPAKTGPAGPLATAMSQVCSIMQNIERGCACFQVKYYKVCIARAALNESVCEDSHSEYM